jgi:hypothetical protein
LDSRLRGNDSSTSYDGSAGNDGLACYLRRGVSTLGKAFGSVSG